jgi:hypothetical protein
MYLDVVNWKLTDSRSYLAGVVKESKGDYFREHYFTGSEELKYLDFTYTLMEYEKGGKDYIDELRSCIFTKNHYSPSIYFGLEYVEVPREIYRELGLSD